MYARGRGYKSSSTLSKMLVLATVPVHETSLANQNFHSTLLGRREGVCKRVLYSLYSCENAENYRWSLNV